MREHIARAINERRRLSFLYEARHQITVEPCLLGKMPNGQDALLCWQIAPPMAYGKNWRLLSLDSMSELQLQDLPDRLFENSTRENR